MRGRWVGEVQVFEGYNVFGLIAWNSITRSLNSIWFQLQNPEDVTTRSLTSGDFRNLGHQMHTRHDGENQQCECLQGLVWLVFTSPNQFQSVVQKNTLNNER
ncbi:hypothetical protein WICPIJ_009845 [Wickerhamomyces pijperi]|uniref:Uncharacterized protein n=1 Tax=Wickerhamomyces pijperi TaxID=599730 RepID=A0A9P8TCL4_WICPI|nr:hypothetical protein WICPIJ_009845 [Wickerhamomyces pijperi]